MNCPKCGHPMKDHQQVHELVICDICERTVKPYSYCSISFAEVERDAWKVEAMAAREYVAFLENKLDVYVELWEVPTSKRSYRAARVKDGE